MGQAVCRRLARDGMAVGVLDIDEHNAVKVAEQIVKSNGKALAVKADLADRPELDAAVAKVREELGPIEVLVNAAGIESYAAFEELSLDAWERVIAVNLTGAFNAAQAVLPDMKRAKYGRIVIISSSSGQTGNPWMAGYASSKGGVIALTKSLAMELGPMGITVNSVSPGFIDTPMAQRAISTQKHIVLDELLKTFPVQRMGKPEEIAGACAYLVSEDAGYTNGQILGVNGGIV